MPLISTAAGRVSSGPFRRIDGLPLRKNSGAPSLPYDLTTYNLAKTADLWLSSKTIEHGMDKWVDYNSPKGMPLGSDLSVQTSDPTTSLGTPNTLVFDGTDDRMFLDDAGYLDPGDLDNAGGTFTALVSGVWDSAAAANDSVLWMRNSSANEYLQIVSINSTTLRVIDRPASGSTSLNSTVTDLADGEVFTVALAIDGSELSITVVRDEDSGVRGTATRVSGSTLSFDDLYLGTLNTGSAPWPGSISDVQVFSSSVLTTAQVEAMHDLNRAALYPDVSTDVGHQLILDNADYWLSSADINSGMQEWFPRIGGNQYPMRLGATTAVSTDDPTVDAASLPRTLNFDGTDDEMRSHGGIPASTALTTINSQLGSYTIICHFEWESGMAINDRVFELGTNGGGARIISLLNTSSTAARIWYLDSSGSTYSDTISGMADGDVLTVAAVVDGDELDFLYRKNGAAAVATATKTRGSGTFTGNPHWLGLGSRSTSSAPSAFQAAEISDLVLMPGYAASETDVNNIGAFLEEGGPLAEPAHTKLLEDAAAWWSSKDISDSMTGWVPRVGAAGDELFLGTDATSETSDPTIDTSGAINTLTGDRTDDRLTLTTPSAGILPPDVSSGSGNYTMLISGYVAAADASVDYIFSFGKTTSGLIRMGIYQQSGVYRVFHRGDSGSPSNVVVIDTAPVAGSRVTYAIVFDGTTLRAINQNGTENTATLAATTDLHTVDRFGVLSAAGNVYSSFSDFGVTDCAIFQSALTEDEVADIHHFLARNYS